VVYHSECDLVMMSVDAVCKQELGTWFTIVISVNL